jgi:hypothetical protein
MLCSDRLCCVSTEVHGGAKEICMAFLKPDPSEAADSKSAAAAADDDDDSGAAHRVAFADDDKSKGKPKPPPLPPLPAAGKAPESKATPAAPSAAGGEDGKYTPAQKALLRGAMRRFLAVRFGTHFRPFPSLIFYCCFCCVVSRRVNARWT